ncbi:glycosyltransferase [Methylotenera sp.]|uniref:glycosyltransferase family 2 protein n=1 Tax=Methylotenera sp. TaxID=2051956 RepID=UPI00248721AC|nr:glycosyltransferase [Methylotenera sp.]MDI1362009.1 glycosyltransferase [Methylotenera sp.]
MQASFLSKAPTVSKHHGTINSTDEVFSIVIPSWNNLDFLKTCINSLRKNSRYSHQIIIHLNEGIDGSLSWVKEQGLDYTHSVENIGICYAMNIARTLATSKLLVYFNDDMYACPDWDFWLYEEVKKQTSPYFFLSCTMIEPRESGNMCVIAPFDFGSNPENFNETTLLEHFSKPIKDDWNGATWPPSVLPTMLWDLVGGYSTDFSPGMYSDPDFSMKLWEFGVRDFKGISQSRVYHFMSKSTGKLTFKKNGSHLFLRKWGISSNLFTQYYLRRGQSWSGPLNLPSNTFKFKMKLWLNKMKRKFI